MVQDDMVVMDELSSSKRVVYILEESIIEERVIYGISLCVRQSQSTAEGVGDGRNKEVDDSKVAGSRRPPARALLSQM
jgi:hypothetical protein